MSENRNRRNRRHFPKDRDRVPAEPRPERVLPDCGICGKPIRDIFSSIFHRDKEAPVHFDCVMQEIAAAESLQEGERLAYLGSGVFAVIRQSPGQGNAGFTIRKRIQYEDKEKAAAWRRTLSVTAG